MLDVKEDMKIDIQVYSPYNLIYVQYQEATVHPPPPPPPPGKDCLQTDFVIVLLETLFSPLHILMHAP